MTTTETGPHPGSISPLPTIGNRQHLPLLAVRISNYDSGARHVIKTPTYRRGAKCVSFKTTSTRIPLQTRARTSPDTTAASSTHTAPTKRKYRHTAHHQARQQDRRLFLGLVVGKPARATLQTQSECVNSPTFQYKIY